MQSDRKHFRWELVRLLFLLEGHDVPSEVDVGDLGAVVHTSDVLQSHRGLAVRGLVWGHPRLIW